MRNELIITTIGEPVLPPHEPATFNLPPEGIKLKVGASTDLDQFVVKSFKPLVWEPQDNPNFSLAADGTLTIKTVGPSTQKVFFEDGYPSTA